MGAAIAGNLSLCRNLSGIMLLTLTRAQNRYDGRCLLNPDKTAAVFSDGKPGVFCLAGPGSAAQLLRQLIDLAEPRSSDRVAFRFKTAGWIDGYPTAECRFAALSQPPSLTYFAKA
jgi:hypothetical protein